MTQAFRLLAFILCFAACASAQNIERNVFTDTLHGDWRLSGGTMIAGARFDGAPSCRFVVNGWGAGSFRSGAWGTPRYVDTTNLTGGRITFAVRASRRCNIRFRLTSDAGGAFAPVALAFDSLVWRVIDTPLAALNASALRFNGMTWQEYNGRTLTFDVAAVRLVERPPVVVPRDTVPPALAMLSGTDSLFHRAPTYLFRLSDFTRLYMYVDNKPFYVLERIDTSDTLAAMPFVPFALSVNPIDEGASSTTFLVTFNDTKLADDWHRFTFEAFDSVGNYISRHAHFMDYADAPPAPVYRRIELSAPDTLLIIWKQ